MRYTKPMCSCIDIDGDRAAALVLWDFDRYLAEQLDAGELTEAELRTLERIREQLHRLVTDANGAELAA